MKKLLPTIIFLSCLAGSSGAFAVTGTVPKCTSGALNTVITNKNLVCLGDAGKYCIGTPLHTSVTPYKYGGTSCQDVGGIIYANENDSVSYSHKPKTIEYSYTIFKIGSKKTHKLHFIYKHGKVTDNCNQVFDGDVKCVITKSGSRHHRIYTLTISNNS